MNTHFDLGDLVWSGRRHRIFVTVLVATATWMVEYDCGKREPSFLTQTLHASYETGKRSDQLHPER